MKHRCNGWKKKPISIHAKYLFLFMLNWYIWNSSEQSVELSITRDLTLALLSPLMLHFCFEFCTMFEMESCVSLEKPNTTARVCFLSEKQEKQQWDTHLSCADLGLDPANSRAHTHTHTGRHTQLNMHKDANFMEKGPPVSVALLKSVSWDRGFCLGPLN